MQLPIHNAEKPSVYAGLRVVGDGIEVGCGRRSGIVTSYSIRIIEIPKIRG